MKVASTLPTSKPGILLPCPGFRIDPNPEFSIGGVIRQAVVDLLLPGDGAHLADRFARGGRESNIVVCRKFAAQGTNIAHLYQTKVR